MKYKSTNAFTLIELSIVITIISIIMITISFGGSLIKTAKINSLIKEIGNYKAAILAFKNQYGSYPGDLINASTIWTNCTSVSTNCNGNGDGLVSYSNEAQQVWQHLVLANLISGNYDGSQFAAAKFHPFLIWMLEANTNNIYTIAKNSKNSLELMMNNNGSLGGSFISSVDAYRIDQKIDDAIPSDGLMYTLDVLDSGCIKQADNITNASPSYNSLKTSYNLTQNKKVCDRLYFYFD